jgi:hypothetical protein
MRVQPRIPQILERCRAYRVLDAVGRLADRDVAGANRFENPFEILASHEWKMGRFSAVSGPFSLTLAITTI